MESHRYLVEERIESTKKEQEVFLVKIKKRLDMLQLVEWIPHKKDFLNLCTQLCELRNESIELHETMRTERKKCKSGSENFFILDKFEMQSGFFNTMSMLLDNMLIIDKTLKNNINLVISQGHNRSLIDSHLARVTTTINSVYLMETTHIRYYIKYRDAYHENMELFLLIIQGIRMIPESINNWKEASNKCVEINSLIFCPIKDDINVSVSTYNLSNIILYMLGFTAIPQHAEIHKSVEMELDRFESEKSNITSKLTGINIQIKKLSLVISILSNCVTSNFSNSSMLYSSVHEKLVRKINEIIPVDEKDKFIHFTNAINNKNYSVALRTACTSNHEKIPELVKLLMYYKTVLNIKINEQAGEMQYSALHHAARKDNRAVYDYLISQGALDNLKDASGKTPNDYFPAKIISNNIS